MSEESLPQRGDRERTRRIRALLRAAQGISTERLEQLAQLPGLLRPILDYTETLLSFGDAELERPLTISGRASNLAVTPPLVFLVYGERFVVWPDERDGERKVALLRLADLVRTALDEEPTLEVPAHG